MNPYACFSKDAAAEMNRRATTADPLLALSRVQIAKAEVRAAFPAMDEAQVEAVVLYGLYHIVKPGNA